MRPELKQLLRSKLEALRGRPSGYSGSKFLHENSTTLQYTSEDRSAEGEAVLKDVTFLELFAGEAGLTKAVQRAGGVVMDPVDVNDNDATVNFDLRKTGHFKKLKKLIKEKKVRWLHLAPPCKTFSRARRRDKYANARRLRSVQFPGGLEPKSALVKEANLLAARSAQLATLQMKAMGWFSIENPERSFIWLYKPMAKLSKTEGVQFVVGDQCMFNGEYRKPTGWLTNAPHLQILAKRCPGDEHHQHPPLEGFAFDFWGSKTFLTSLAAEYPQGLCEELAKSFLKSLELQPDRQPMVHKLVKDSDGRRFVESKKGQQEAENDECVGGLRNPVYSIQKVPGWKAVGSLLFEMLGSILRSHPEWADQWRWIGKMELPDKFLVNTILSAVTASVFGLKSKLPERGLWGDLLVKLVHMSGDPDKEAATWPSIGAPLGIEEHLAPGGVFPKVQGEDQFGESERLEKIAELQGAQYNYVSYEEHKDAAEALFEKERQQGFAVWSAKREDLEKTVGTLVPSAIGVIKKVKRDGTEKYRLVHDLRRSGINETIKFEERLVLPRMKDLLEDVLLLLEHKIEGERVCLMSLDFADAFKQIPVRESEQRYLSGQMGIGWFYYRTVLFGIRTGPLVWGRVAALASRCTQSMFHEMRLRVQLYVDDPMVSMRGTPEQIHDMTNRVLMLWRTLGLKISWAKGALGEEADWIGAGIKVNNHKDEVTVFITEEKVQEWKCLIAEAAKKPMVSKRQVSRLAGKMNWAAGMIQQAKPVVRMLYSAMSHCTTMKDGQEVIYQQQLAPALGWLSKLLAGFSHGLQWTVKAHVRHHCCLEIVVDASPWGGGAIKYVKGKNH